MDVVMLVSLCLIKAQAASEHGIRTRHQRPLGVFQLHGCELEISKFVHAIVNHRRSVDVRGKGVHHRRVVPEDGFHPTMQLEQFVQQVAKRFLPIRLGPPMGILGRTALTVVPANGWISI